MVVVERSTGGVGALLEDEPLKKKKIYMRSENERRKETKDVRKNLESSTDTCTTK